MTEIVVAAPSNVDAEEFVSASGDLLVTLPVAFRIQGDTATPVYYPTVPGIGKYERITIVGGRLSAHGIIADRSWEISNALREKSK